MAAAGVVVELVFKALGWIPQQRSATIAEAHISLNYTTALDVVFLLVGAVLVWRAATTGGFAMLRHMNATNSGKAGRRP
jgi:hypothetical protein